MNKRVLRILTILIVILCSFMFLLSCNDKEDNSWYGTYYLYINDMKIESTWIKLEGNEWSTNAGNSGRIEKKDDIFYCYYNYDGQDILTMYGTISDGIFKWTVEGNYYLEYYKDGCYIAGSGSGTSAGNNVVQFTVSFDSKGGSDVESKQVDIGGKLTAPAQPVKVKYLFIGWYKDEGCTRVWDFDADIVTENTILYAKWELDETRINVVNGASIDGTEITLIVDEECDAVGMSDKVVLNSDTATWKMYYDKLGRDEIRTKIATNDSGFLKPGSNLFYIVVTSFDGTRSKTYTLDIYKKYYVVVNLLFNDIPVGAYSALSLSELTIPEDIFIKGYTINEWIGDSVQVGEIIPKNYSAVINLTAYCTPNTYTVTFDANGGTVSKTSESITFNSVVFFPIPERTGYSFMGWKCANNPETINNGLSIWGIDSDITLTAEWLINTYTIEVVSENVNAGSVRIESYEESMNEEQSSNSTSSAFIISEYASNVVLTATEKGNYSFDGWFDGDECVSKDIRCILSVPAEDKTYTAKWTYYCITTDTNLPEAGTYTAKTDEKVKVGNAVTLSASTNNGYTWMGWYDGDTKVSEGTSLDYSFIMSAENKFYTAKWIVCPISIEKNIDEAGSVHGVAGKTAVGGEVTITAISNDNGYTWMGWYDGDTKVSEGTSMNYTFVMGIEKKTYTAKWTYYCITTNTNFPEAGTYTVKTDEKAKVGAAVTLSANTNSGYTWMGWYDGDTKVSEGASLDYTFIMGEEDKVYTAKWMSCPIMIEKNIDEAGSVHGVEETAVDGEVTLTATSNEGYTWMGWYDGDTKVSEGASMTYTFLMGVESKTYTAKWSYYTITYEIEGDGNVNNPLYFTNYSEIITLNTPSRDNTEEIISVEEHLGNGRYRVTKEVTEYSFIGWYKESEFENEVTEIAYIGEDIVLYAKWGKTTTTIDDSYQVFNLEYNILTFGSYPQTQVTDSTLCSTLSDLAGTLPTAEDAQAWTSYEYYISGTVTDYMWYIDLTHAGEKYRGVYFSKYRPTNNSLSSSYNYQDDNGYFKSTVYWFKYVPLKWRKISENSSQALLHCINIIDSQNYYSDKNSHEGGEDANDYALSTIRLWLNESFYNMAFDENQKAIIQGNSDKVFLFSIDDVSRYPFNSDYTAKDSNRVRGGTDYAKCQGNVSGQWWLKSKYATSTFTSTDEVLYVNPDGRVTRHIEVNDTGVGVVPALRIRIS